MNVPMFLFAKLVKVANDFKKSKGSEIGHQGLILVIFKHVTRLIGILDSFVWGVVEGRKIKGNRS